MKTERLPIGKLALNSGQIDGLPANPRQWTRADVDRIAKSLRETPELFEMRPCIVTPHGGKYVILAGSLRYCGAQANGDTHVPAIVFEGDTDKMKEIVLKDNGSFGAWDMDALANEWDDLSLADWGVPAWNADNNGGSPEDYGEDFSLPDGDKQPFQQVSFNLANDQASLVKQCIADAKQLEEYKYQETFGNTNCNGNALYLIVKQWAEQRK